MTITIPVASRSHFMSIVDPGTRVQKVQWTFLENPQPAHNVCFNVDFRSRRRTTYFQRWNNVIDFNVGKTTHFQRRFNV